METTGEGNDNVVPQVTNEERSDKGVPQQPTTDANHGNDAVNDDPPSQPQQPPYISFQSVLETLDPEEKSDLVTLLLRFRFQEEQFNWMLMRKAGWTFDMQLGAYHAPPPQADEYSNHLPTLTLTAVELHDYLDRFAVTPLKSFLHIPANPLAGMSEMEIQRGRALRERVVLMKFEQERRRNSTNNKDEASAASAKKISSGKSQPRNNDSTSSSQRRSSTRQSTNPATAIPKAVAPDILPQSQRPRRTSTTTTTTTTTSSGPTTKTASATIIEPGADMYFKKAKAKANKKQSKSKTAEDAINDATTAPFKLPSASECAKMVADMSLSSPETESELQAIEDSYAKSFLDWKFLLMTNHSLLLHGFGSKQKLLHRFAEEELDKEGDVLTIDGFDSEVTIEGILDVIVLAFLDGKEPTTLAGGKRKAAPGTKSSSVPANGISSTIPSNFLDTHPIVRRATSISRALASKVSVTLKPAILVLHSIDGVPLRNNAAQEALAALVLNSTLPNTSTAMRGLWFVASADHVDVATLLWDTVSSASFAWIWREVHTYQPHLNEIAMMDQYDEAVGDASKKKSRKRAIIDPAVAESFAFTVLDSVAPRHVEVVQVLAGLQLQLQASQPWVSIVTLREQLMEKCIVRSDEQLRGYLDELNDHGIIETQSQRKVRIPYSKDKLLEILEYKKVTK